MICVDASVVIKWFFLEDYTELAIALLDDASTAKEPLVAPALLRDEVTNNIHQRMRRGDITEDTGDRILREFLQLRVRRRTPARLHIDALHLSARYGLSASYDAQYLVVAQSVDAPFWTDDKRLLRELGGRLAFVRWIGDYIPVHPAPRF